MDQISQKGVLIIANPYANHPFTVAVVYIYSVCVERKLLSVLAKRLKQNIYIYINIYVYVYV